MESVISMSNKIYRKKKRMKKSNAWHCLSYRSVIDMQASIEFPFSVSVWVYLSHIVILSIGFFLSLAFALDADARPYVCVSHIHIKNTIKVIIIIILLLLLAVVIIGSVHTSLIYLPLSEFNLRVTEAKKMRDTLHAHDLLRISYHHGLPIKQD